MDLIKILFGKHIRKNIGKCHFGEDDIIIENYCLNAIHEIPIKILEGMEFDFYINNGKDIYILRVQNKPENKIIFVNKSHKKITLLTYIIVKKILQRNIDEELKIIIEQLNKIIFPKYYKNKIYDVEKWE
ncbi:hypothetical protein FACS1894151_01200 [Spirochaetia bacterium]|nr:hypothetical protein FACS1894151_01200 [Spirochaetia bacterium]